MDLRTAQDIYRQGEASTVAYLIKQEANYQGLLVVIEEKERQIAFLQKNSLTSSKPPSSDDLTKKNYREKEPQKGKKGAQKGHAKHARVPFTDDEIDESISYQLFSCPRCKSTDTILQSDQPVRTIQQIELKEMPVVIKEFKVYAIWCDHCQSFHEAAIPEQILKSGLFGEKMTALVAYLKYVCHASFSTIRKFFRDILQIKISRGYLVKLINKVSEALKSTYLELLHRLPLEEVLKVDETGHKNNGDRFWTWVFKADLYVLFKVDKSRGSKVLIEVLGENFNGVLSCDYFSAYRKFRQDFNVTVQFCLAHLIRNIRFLTTITEPLTQKYANNLLAAIKDMFRLIHEKEKMTSADFFNQTQIAKRKILSAATVNAPSKLDENGKEKLTEVKNMVDRFTKFGEAYFEFITTPGVDPTNNLAEQAIRFIVIDRYITQGTRSDSGQRASERIWTVIGTCQLQGRSAFDFLHAAVVSFFRGTKSPSLLVDTG